MWANLKNALGVIWSKIRSELLELPGAVRGFYFIRFAIALWLFPLILCLVDLTGAATLTRAILTPERGRQALSAGFMLFSLGTIVVINIRLVALNGAERFCDLGADNWLPRRWGQQHISWLLFGIGHFAGAVLLARVAWNMWREGNSKHVHFPEYLAMLAGGVVLGWFFWLFILAFYWWSFDSEQYKGRFPRDLLFPRGLVPLHSKAIKSIQVSPPPPLIRWLNFLFKPVTRAGGGLVDSGNPAMLYEGHKLALIAFLGLVLIYVYMFAFTAPVLLPVADLVCSLFTALLLVVVFVGVASGSWPKRLPARLVKGSVSLVVMVLILLIVASYIFHEHGPRAFSVLASLLVLVIGFFWFLSAVAFVTDASRLPLVSFALFLFFVSSGLADGATEHYFTARLTKGPAVQKVPEPAEILRNRLGAPDPAVPLRPLIIVTAEGGGIHSAAWTAAVLMELERQFYKKNPANTFHANLLLASTVSGGSVGLLAFLREYASDGEFKDLNATANRVTIAASCSSLAAVAWGLSYYDALHFVLPLPWHGDGVTWSNGVPGGWDRSWALERAFARNLDDDSCRLTGSLGEEVADVRTRTGYELTLGNSPVTSNQPAFTLNTTVVETGGRFLLANYQLPAGADYADVLPAESFLHAYGYSDLALDQKDKDKQHFADLPLVTAARLSATFPYISSASRIPKDAALLGYHFVDGGYFDNDGTSSVVEFLHYALTMQCQQKEPGEPLPAGCQEPCPAPQPTVIKPRLTPDQWPYCNQRAPILLIEIRNDQDLDAKNNQDSFEKQEQLTYQSGKNGGGTWVPATNRKVSRWGPADQLAAPPIGFWNAGHTSDTRRNRRELCMFEKGYKDRVVVHHMVFDYRDNEGSEEPQPLSWELTPRQQQDIQCAIDPRACMRDSGAHSRAYNGQGDRTIRELAAIAAKWFNDQKRDMDQAPCTVFERGKPE